jgi:hypothetical protein
VSLQKQNLLIISQSLHFFSKIVIAERYLIVNHITCHVFPLEKMAEKHKKFVLVIVLSAVLLGVNMLHVVLLCELF